MKTNRSIPASCKSLWRQELQVEPVRGVAKHSVTLLCIPLPLHASYSHHHDLPPKLLDLLHPSSLSITCHITWLISAPKGAAAGHRDVLGQEGSSAAGWAHGDQDPGCCPVFAGSPPAQPPTSLGRRAWPWSTCQDLALVPSTPTAEQTDK